MEPEGRPYTQWPTQQPSGSRPFLPVAGTFSDAAANTPSQPAPHPRQLGQPAMQYVSPQQIFQQQQVAFTSAEYNLPQIPFPRSTYSDLLHGPFLTNSPVVHEGFIPAPGQEEEDDVYPAYPSGYQYDMQSSSEEDSEEDELLHDITEKNDLEADKDYSTSDDELQDDDDEILPDEDSDEDDKPTPKRAKSKGKATRGGQRGRTSGRGRGGFRSTIIQKAKKGSRPRGRPKGKIGPRPAADPGPQFKELQRLANDAYMRNNFALALDYAQQAVRLNPEIFSVHNTISEIYAAMGQEQLSINALIIGGPTKRDKGLWWLIIDRVEKIDPTDFPQFTDEYKTDIYVNCLKSIIQLDSNDYNARSRKLEIEAKLGKFSTCVKLCRKMLDLRPHDYNILKQMAILGTSSPKDTRIHLDRIIECYEFSIAYFVTHDDPVNSNLDWSLLNIYLDLLDRSGDYIHALSRLKTLSRWKQNRQDETYWDQQEDDREFDLDDVPRRIAVSEFSSASNKLKHGKSRRPKYGRSLPLEIRIKMGLFRLRQSPPNLTEAMYHLEMLEPWDDSPDALLWDYPDLFRLAADTLHTTGHDREALQFYEPAFRHAREQLHLKSLIGIYTCYKNLNELENAEKIVPILKDWNATFDDLAILSKFFEDNGMHEEAWQRAEIVYRNRGAWRLRKIGFKRYQELARHFFDLRKQARGKHGVRKSRVRKHIKKVKAATRIEIDSDNEDAPSERPSLGPLGVRPAQGLFRSKERLTAKKMQTFLPVDSEPLENMNALPLEGTNIPLLEGTNVPLDVIDHKFFRRKLEKLAADHANELNVARAQHREIIASFERLDELCEEADDGEEAASAEYISIARELVQEFSTFDLFYSDRKLGFRGYFRRIGSGDIWKVAALMALAVEANRIEDGEKERELKEKPDVIPQEFYGIHFDKWVDAFGRYALFLARKGDKDRCFSALDVALQSNIFFRSQTYSYQAELCRLACALAVDDSLQVSSAVRWLLKNYPFGSHLFRLYSAVNRLCSIAGGYATGPAHKVLMRYIKTIDFALLNPEQREWFNFRGNDRTQWKQYAESPEIVKHVKDHDPALFALYGHVFMCSGSYIGALNYYFRAFAITPEDPVLNLSIGIAYLQHSMKRLSENRQFQIQQALSFVNRYYELRTKENIVVHCSEAEYNIGRIWHALGLTTQATSAYERCIALSRHVQRGTDDSVEHPDVEDFAVESAFGIQTISILSGDFERARRVTDAMLVIE